MAVTILGSGTTPVVGAREFEPIAGSDTAVTIVSGDIDNYMISSTGVGNQIKGEPNVTFDGSTFQINGTLDVSSIPSASTGVVLNYNSTTGVISYATAAGGGDVSKVGTPLTTQVGYWTGDGTLAGHNNLIWTGSQLTVNGTVHSQVSYIENMAEVVTTAILNYNTVNGLITYNSSGGGTANFLRADGSWVAPGIDTAGSGLTKSTSTVNLTGALSVNAALTGGGSYSFAATGLTTAEIEAGTSSKVSYATGGNEKSITLANASMLITDTEDTKGLQYAADYDTNGAAIGDLWIPSKGYVDTAIASQISAASTGYLVARGELLFGSPDTPVNIVTIPANGVIWNIKVYVGTVFDDTGVNTIHIGTSGQATRYEDASTVLTGTGFRTLTLSNIEDYMSGSTTITCSFVDGDAAASTGQAYVYVIYSTF